MGYDSEEFQRGFPPAPKGGSGGFLAAPSR